jgi:molybdopterin synthase sulfur carrier subunit
MRVRVKLFGSLREALAESSLDVDLPEGATPEAVWGHLVARRAGLAERRTSLTAAVNRRYAPFDWPLAEGDEIVFIPPVSGG